MRLEKSFDRQLNIKQILFAVMIFVVCITSSSFEINGQTVSTSETPPETKIEDYRIGPGDVVDIVVSKNDTLSRRDVRVSNEGMIQLPMLDADISAACQTEKGLSTLIAEKYKKYLLNPNVIVAVKQFNSTPVAVIGSVNAPIRFQLQRPMRLMEALLVSNGPTLKAGPTVQIIRNNSLDSCRQNVTASDIPNEQLLTFALKETLDGKDQANPLLQPGDVVRVVEAAVEKIGQVYIIGNVKSATKIDLTEPVTLNKAIAMAGGIAPDAQTDKIKITRQIAGSQNTTDIIVNLKELKKREGEFQLQHNDIIEVPGSSGAKKFLKDIFRSIIPAVTRFPVPIP